MDPNTPSTPPSFQPEQPQTPEPTPPQQNPQVGPPRKSKKTLIITLVIVGVVLIIGLIAGLLFASQNKGETNTNNTDTADNSLYYDRPGYDRSKLAASIGDPLGIVMTPAKETQTLTNGTKVIPACSVVSQNDLKKEDLKLLANDYGFPVQQNYLSKTGKASFIANANQMPLFDETLGCSYGFDANKGLTITVNQAFTVKDTVVTQWANTLGFKPDVTMDGYATFKREESDNTSYLLRKAGDAIYLRFTGVEDKDKITSLVKTAVKNLNSFESTPTGISDITYESPTFTEKYVKACDLTDNDDLKALSGNDASPLVQEKAPTSTGVADFGKVSDYKTKSNYVRNQCIRTANKPEYKTLIGNQKHTLQVTTTTYENEEAAKNGLLYYAVGENNSTKTTVEGIGNEAFAFSSTEDKQNTLAFRQGKVVVELLYDYANQKADPAVANLSTYAEKLSPLGIKVAEKVKSL